jgi:hypothetical protein
MLMSAIGPQGVDVIVAVTFLLHRVYSRGEQHPAGD